MLSQYGCLANKVLSVSVGSPLSCFCGAPTSYPVGDSDIKYWKVRERERERERERGGSGNSNQNDSGKKGIDVCGKINRDIHLAELADS